MNKIRLTLEQWETVLENLKEFNQDEAWQRYEEVLTLLENK